MSRKRINDKRRFASSRHASTSLSASYVAASSAVHNKIGAHAWRHIAAGMANMDNDLHRVILSAHAPPPPYSAAFRHRQRSSCGIGSLLSSKRVTSLIVWRLGSAASALTSATCIKHRVSGNVSRYHHHDVACHQPNNKRCHFSLSGVIRSAATTANVSVTASMRRTTSSCGDKQRQ